MKDALSFDIKTLIERSKECIIQDGQLDTIFHLLPYFSHIDKVKPTILNLKNLNGETYFLKNQSNNIFVSLLSSSRNHSFSLVPIYDILLDDDQYDYLADAKSLIRFIKYYSYINEMDKEYRTLLDNVYDNIRIQGFDLVQKKVIAFLHSQGAISGTEIRINTSDITAIREQFSDKAYQLLHDAIRKKFQIHNLEKIVAAFPPINDKSGKTLLLYAIENKNKAAIKLLQKYGNITLIDTQKIGRIFLYGTLAILPMFFFKTLFSKFKYQQIRFEFFGLRYGGRLMQKGFLALVKRTLLMKKFKSMR